MKKVEVGLYEQGKLTRGILELTECSDCPTGDITGITAGTGLDGGGISGGIILNVDYAGTDNFIDVATNLEGTEISVGDTIVYHDASDDNIKKGFVSDLPFFDEQVFTFSARGSNSNASNWWGPNYQGLNNYSWSKDYGTDATVLVLDEEYINAGLLVPYDCILTGFFTIGHTSSGTAGYSCGLWYITQSNLLASLNVTSGTAGDATLTLAGAIGTSVNPGNGKNPLTINRINTMSVALTQGSMIYPRTGDSAVGNDTTWNVYLKRT
jgi:hypothetical protein|tara:strand:- start:241 stop:1041 length:801 start_codon:yes stop_codon:yes gene_type:complete